MKEVLHTGLSLEWAVYLFASSTKLFRMKWVLTHQSAGYHRWLLSEAEQPAQLTFNLQNNSLRIKAQKARLFFLELTEKFFGKKVLLRSEYGVVLGEAAWSGGRKRGTFWLNGGRYFYSWSHQRLSLFDKNKKPLFDATVECRKDTSRLEVFAFLFSTAWLHSAESKKPEALLVA